MDIIIPRRVGDSHPLRESLRERNRRRFYAQADMANALSNVGARYRLDAGEALDALLTSLVSVVHYQVPSTVWGDVGEMLADELRARLTVTGDTGSDHRRRMI